MYEKKYCGVFKLPLICDKINTNQYVNGRQEEVMLKDFKAMAELVKANPVKKRIVLCCAHDEHSLDAVYEAYKEGIVEPVFVGKEEEIKKVEAWLNSFGKCYQVPERREYRCHYRANGSCNPYPPYRSGIPNYKCQCSPACHTPPIAGR